MCYFFIQHLKEKVGESAVSFVFLRSTAEPPPLYSLPPRVWITFDPARRVLLPAGGGVWFSHRARAGGGVHSAAAVVWQLNAALRHTEPHYHHQHHYNLETPPLQCAVLSPGMWHDLSE